MKKLHKNSKQGFFWKKDIDIRTIILIVVLVALAMFFGFVDKFFFTFKNIDVMAILAPEMGLMGLGMALSLMLNGVNLSINNGANLSALISGLFLINIAPIFGGGNVVISIGITVIIAIGVGILCGLLNGFLIGYLKIQAIIATLATMIVFSGISEAITGGKSLTNFPHELQVISTGAIGGIPIPFLIFLAMVIIVYIILEFTSLGFEIQMVGTNPIAAQFSGINVRLVIMETYILSNVLGSLSGIIVMSFTNSVSYEYGTGTYILLALLISVLAGVTPGFGSTLGVFLATLIFEVLSSGFQMLLSGLNGSSFFTDFSWGIFFIGILIIVNLAQKVQNRT